MKKLTSFIALCALVVATATAQVADYRGVKVSQSGNKYTATYSKKSANGGTANEKWTGNLVDGKRSGTWTFTGTYNQFIMEGGRCRNGLVSMTRTYKDGIPSGPYSVTYNITERNASYNFITDSWIFGEKHDMSEKVVGAFLDGKPHGKWTTTSQRNHETWIMNFVNGYADGVWKSNINNEGQEFTFKNGYGFYQKVPQDDGSWGYELKYDKDPATIFPQDTLKVGESIMYNFNYYTGGMFIITNWAYDYPKNASNEDTHGYYILSDFKKYYQPYGNVPERIIIQLKNKKEQEIVDAIDRFANDTLLTSYQQYAKQIQGTPINKFLRKLNDIFQPRRSGELYPTAWYEQKYLRDSLAYGMYKEKYERYWNILNELNRTSQSMSNIERMCSEVTDTCIIYEAAMLKMRQELSNMGYENVPDEDIWKLFRSKEYTQMKKDYQHRQDSIATREALVLNEKDIYYFVISNCFKYTIENDRVTSVEQIIEDPFVITNEEIIDFVVQHADKQNRRYYLDDALVRKFDMYVENSPGNIVAKKKNKLIKQLKKRFDL